MQLAAPRLRRSLAWPRQARSARICDLGPGIGNSSILASLQSSVTSLLTSGHGSNAADNNDWLDLLELAVTTDWKARGSQTRIAAPGSGPQRPSAQATGPRGQAPEELRAPHGSMALKQGQVRLQRDARRTAELSSPLSMGQGRRGLCGTNEPVYRSLHSAAGCAGMGVKPEHHLGGGAALRVSGVYGRLGQQGRLERAVALHWAVRQRCSAVSVRWEVSSVAGS